MKADYYSKGEYLDYFNNTNSKIIAGDIVNLNTMIGVAVYDIPVGKVGFKSVVVTGVYKMKKLSGIEIIAGDKLYYKNNFINNIAGTDAGYAFNNSYKNEIYILVKLKG